MSEAPLENITKAADRLSVSRMSLGHAFASSRPPLKGPVKNIGFHIALPISARYVRASR